jgi:hypothetical protein
LGGCKFGNKQRSRTEDNTVAKAKQESRCDEHPKSGGASLKTNTKTHDERPNEDTRATAERIDDIRHKEETNQRTETHGSVE